MSAAKMCYKEMLPQKKPHLSRVENIACSPVAKHLNEIIADHSIQQDDSQMTEEEIGQVKN